MESMAESMTTLPPGEYWVGDPCYAFEDSKVWMALLESADYTSDRRILEASAEGEAFIASGTAYGDGCYLDRGGNEYWVDAGLIGVTPAREGKETPDGMLKVAFSCPVSVEYCRGVVGIVSGGSRIEIDTNGDGWDD